jgi:hypothetical protein
LDNYLRKIEELKAQLQLFQSQTQSETQP